MIEQVKRAAVVVSLGVAMFGACKREELAPKAEPDSTGRAVIDRQLVEEAASRRFSEAMNRSEPWPLTAEQRRQRSVELEGFVMSLETKARAAQIQSDLESANRESIQIADQMNKAAISTSRPSSAPAVTQPASPQKK